MKKQFYSMEKNGNEASINIYGDITSWASEELGEVSAVTLSKQLTTLENDVSQINVYINSYGGEVAEGLAIYNALKRHKAKVVTYCDGFAASIASVIFMAGDERIMNDSSLLMIHNAWTFGMGNAEQLRKQADDLEKITQASVIAYAAHSTLSEDEIKALMDAETWILPEEALEYGFATKIEKTEKKTANQNAKMKLFDIIKAYRQKSEDEDTEGEKEETEDRAEKTAEGEEKDKPEDENGEEEKNPTEGENDGDSTNDEDTEDEEEAKEQSIKFFEAILNL